MTVTRRPALVVVGGGRMGTALVGGLVAAGWRPQSITVVEVEDARRAALVDDVPGVQVVADVVPADGAVLAVKPAQAEAASRQMAASGTRRVLSIMAGVTLERLSQWLGPEVAVVRAMPNTPALVRAGMSAIAAGAGAGEADLVWAEEILEAVGEVVRLPEAALDAVTAVSGSGPAYFFLVAEALAEAAEEAGLDPEVSLALVVSTLAGSARLLAESGEQPAALRAQVTSPGGTTEAALSVLEEAGLRRAFAQAVAAAARRSRELGR